MRKKEPEYKPFDAFTEFQSICKRGTGECERCGRVYPEAIREVKGIIDAYYSDCTLTDDELFLQYAFVCNSTAFLRKKRKKRDWIVNTASFYSGLESIETGVAVGIVSSLICSQVGSRARAGTLILFCMGMLLLVFFTVLIIIPWLNECRYRNSMLPTMYDQFLRDYELRKIKSILRKRRLIENETGQVWRITKCHRKAH